MKEPIKMVCVKWRDSSMTHDQCEINPEEFKVCEIESVGWLWYESGDRIVISREVLDNGDARSIIAIPQSNIVWMYELKRGSNEKETSA